MRILSITAQKPSSTGSGIYLTELVKEFAKSGCTQAVIAGVTREDQVELQEGTAWYPVLFESESLPFPVVGMSDEMPYQSTRSCDLTETMTRQFEEAFLEVAEKAVREFQPDLILCHHLYLLTAIIRERFPSHAIYGFCHNTDLRQMQKTDLKRSYIREQIRKLDHIFVPQSAQKQGVQKIYDMPEEQITILGMGYNKDVFHVMGKKPEDGITRLVFAGKIAEKKGVKSLIKSLSYLPCKREELEVLLAGSAGNETEFRQIQDLASKCPYPVRFLGRLAQPELARVYNQSDVFVLPSFFDGLPLTVIEALACGDRVVVTDLPGIRDWIESNTSGAFVRYVPMPKMQNTDEAVEESLPVFERNLADALFASIQTETKKAADVSRISWAAIAKKIRNFFDESF